MYTLRQAFCHSHNRSSARHGLYGENTQRRDYAIIIIFDGNDGTGKSSIAKALSQLTQIPYYSHVRPTLSELNEECISQANLLALDFAFSILSKLGRDVIIDRGLASEAIFGTMFRDANLDEILELEKKFSELNLVQIMCFKDPIERKDDSILSEQEFRQSIKLFQDFYYRGKTRTLLLNTTDENLTAQLAEIQKFLWPHGRSTLQDLTHEIQAIYDAKFSHKYDPYRGNRYLSTAKAFSSALYLALRPQSVVDIGCNIGYWLKEFNGLGVKHTLGIDVSKAAAQNYMAKGSFLLHDLRTPLDFQVSPFDLAVCCEVAEHIPEEHADTFVDTVAQLSRTIFFTAAQPGQGGDDHINEKPQTYWTQKFVARGYIRNRALEENIITLVGDRNDLVSFMPYNMMCFSKRGN